MRIATAHGLHRRSTAHATNPSTQMLSTSTLQNNVRIWWTTYILERSLELLMGRPCQLRDEDIGRESACDLHGFPSCEGLRAHVNLAMIMGQIVSQVLRTRRRKKEDVDNVMAALQTWKETLSSSLRLPDDEYTLPTQSVLLLHLIRNQVHPLAFRADLELILVALRNAILDYTIGANIFDPDPSPPHAVNCPYLNPSIEAARQNLMLAHSLPPRSPYTFHSFHYIFSAAICIVVHSFLANETTSSDGLLVSQAINTLSEKGKINESAESCSKQIRDLRVVVENVKMVREGHRGELAKLSVSPVQDNGEELMYWSI